MYEKKVGKRLLTWVLVLVMTLSLLPLNVLAAGEEPNAQLISEYGPGSGWPGGWDSIDKANTGTITFKIVNGTWNLTNSTGVTVSSDKKTVIYDILE